jgi:hypothetical protein
MRCGVSILFANARASRCTFMHLMLDVDSLPLPHQHPLREDFLFLQHDFSSRSH